MSRMTTSIPKHALGLLGAILITGGILAWLTLSRPLGCVVVSAGLICATIDLLRTHLYIGGTAALILTFWFGFFAGEFAAQPYETLTPFEYFTQYSLFTWKNRSGDLCFKLVLKLERARIEHGWFSKWGGACGVSKLKEALGALPKDTIVAWEQWPPKFDFPEPKLSDDVIQFARSKGIRLEKDPVLE